MKNFITNNMFNEEMNQDKNVNILNINEIE